MAIRSGMEKAWKDGNSIGQGTYFSTVLELFGHCSVDITVYQRDRTA
jgi:hypothetical protein